MENRPVWMWSRHLGKKSESVPKERGHTWFSPEGCATFQGLTPAGLSHSCVSRGRKGASLHVKWQSLGHVRLCDPMDCSPPGSSVHGILQARILEWVAMPSSRGSCQPRGRTQVSNIADGFFTGWATREYPTLIILLIGGYVKLYVSVFSTGHAFFFFFFFLFS